MNELEFLAAREQLMTDVSDILDANLGLVEYKDDLLKQLCTAVCRNFPINSIDK